MKFSAVASEPAAEEAANRILKEEGTAGDALIAAFLAAAAARPGVLWGPVQILVAGPGTFSRAFDGRPRQPGLGLPRPRGVVKSEAVPDVAQVAAPASLGVLALVHAYDSSVTFQKLAEPAIDTARALGVKERRDLLTRIARTGASALAAPATVRALVAVAGRAEGGLLSERDLAEVRPESAAARSIVLGGDKSAFVVPWPSPQAHRPVEIVAATDARGVFAVLGYAPDDDGVSVPELGIKLTRDAVVVRRGIPRVPPGEVLPSPAPMAIALVGQLAFMALGVRSSSPLAIAELSDVWSDPTAPATKLLAAARDAAGGATAVAVVRSPRSPQVQTLSLAEGR